MHKSGQQPPSESRPVLDYARPSGTLGEKIVSLVLGAVIGVGSIFVIGFVVACSVEQGPWEIHSTGAAIFFWASAIAAISEPVYWLLPQHRRFFLPGFLLGVAAMSLLEGYCFMQAS